MLRGELWSVEHPHLASLLQRVERLPQRKAVQIAFPFPLVLLLLRFALRRQWLAGTVFVILGANAFAAFSDTPVLLGGVVVAGMLAL